MKTNLLFITFLFLYISCDLINKDDENIPHTVEIIAPTENQKFFDYGEIKLKIRYNRLDRTFYN